MRRTRRFVALMFVVLFVSAAGAVEPGLPSKTSVWVAIHRAIGAKNPDAQFRNPDYLAEKFVGSRERALLTDYPVDAVDLPYEQALKRIPDPMNVTGLFMRTVHIDATLQDALRDGARQIVVLGAGLDSRAFRFENRLEGVAFFEVDYGPTQEYKKLRVKEIFGVLPSHVRYIPMDFTKDDLLTELRKGGYSERDKTFFIWEGVTRYIPESAVKDTLHFVGDHSSPGSTIFFDYMTSRNPLLNSPTNRTAKWGEPFIFGFPGDGASDFVQREGLEVVSDCTGGDLIKRFAVRTDGTSSLPLPPNARENATSSLGGHCIARVPTK